MGEKQELPSRCNHSWGQPYVTPRLKALQWCHKCNRRRELTATPDYNWLPATKENLVVGGHVYMTDKECKTHKGIYKFLKISHCSNKKVGDFEDMNGQLVYLTLDYIKIQPAPAPPALEEG